MAVAITDITSRHDNCFLWFSAKNKKTFLGNPPILLTYHWLELDYVPHEIIPGKGTEMILRPIRPTAGAGSAYLEAYGTWGMAFVRKEGK